MRRHSSVAIVFVAVCVALVAASGAARAQVCPAPKPMFFHVDSEIARDVRGFTQGLEWRGDRLYESTGAIAGDTRLTTIDPKGHVTVLADFAKMFFGEGLTIFHDQIFQLSWQENAVFVYDLNGKLIRRMRNPHDGWGLTNDGTHLIFTDGGDQLFFVDPTTFDIVRSVQVHLGKAPLEALNELEMVDGKIYANVFTRWNIVRVEPKTGCVEAVADLHALWDRMSADEQKYMNSDSNFVLNGIAYDSQKKLFYLTGKNWRALYVGRFTDGK